MLCQLFLQAHTLLTCFTAECLTLICKKEIHASYITWPSAGVLHLSTTFRVNHVWNDNFTEFRIAWTSFLYHEEFTAAQELQTAHDGASHLPANASDEPRTTMMAPWALLPRLMIKPAVIMEGNPQLKKTIISRNEFGNSEKRRR